MKNAGLHSDTDKIWVCGENLLKRVTFISFCSLTNRIHENSTFVCQHPHIIRLISLDSDSEDAENVRVRHVVSYIRLVYVYTCIAIFNRKTRTYRIYTGY